MDKKEIKRIIEEEIKTGKRMTEFEIHEFLYGKVEKKINEDLNEILLKATKISSRSIISDETVKKVEKTVSKGFKSFFGFGKKIKEVTTKQIDIANDKFNEELDKIVVKANELQTEKNMVDSFSEQVFKELVTRKQIQISYESTLTKGSYLLGELYSDEKWVSKYGYFKIIKRLHSSKRIEYIFSINGLTMEDLYLDYPVDTETIFNVISGNIKEQIAIQ